VGRRAHVQLHMGGNGRGGIVVDGHDLSNAICAYRIEGQAGQHSIITLTLIADVEYIATQADVRVARALEAEQGDVLIDVTPVGATQRQYRKKED
jgi:hypothetical protein